MKQFRTLVKKEFLHVFRDRKTLMMLFLLPIIQIILFGFALTNEVKNIKLNYLDLSKDETTKAIIGKIKANPLFQVEGELKAYTEVAPKLRAGEAEAVLIFPANFEKNLTQQHKAKVQVIADASNPNTASTITAYIEQMVLEYQKNKLASIPQKLPIEISTKVQIVYNPELKSSINFVPGVIAFVLLLVCVMMTSVSIVKEKENGTMEVLLVSPFNPFYITVSKAVPYLLLSLINLSMIILLSIYVLKIPNNGSLLALYLVSILFIITALFLGLLISNISSSQQMAMMISLMGMLVPSILFTGFMFPLENMPYILQIISNIVPSKWYYILVKSIMIKGLGLEMLWKEILILFIMAVVLLIINIKKFKTRLD